MIDARLFADLLAQLAHRGGGVRESGAFLLAPGDRADERWVVVTAFALYDDLDPRSLTGGITFHAEGYSALAEKCRRNRVRVVSDIHTHPRAWVGQSRTDAAHPMSALPGHIALIAPNYASGDIAVHDLGAHVHLGGGRWRSSYGDEVGTLLRVSGGRRGSWLTSWLRALHHRVRQVLTLRRSR
ncbi:hypothetical protein [Amycolatopsis kentuckyensis]|uniref:hypothetical protein n=1 Tax=Amycolatopsis kentuckyensis TaxID=218823 RepID=UPI000A3B9D07|nr:hypothetical protein [Amycolatopsis kentuckyensis]